MSHQVIIIGAGMGGLTAAIRLAQRGFRVTVVEASDRVGGLACNLEFEGLRFDAGPYILLDRPGLEWTFRSLSLELSEHIHLKRIDEVYGVSSEDAPPVRFYHSLDRTVEELEQSWPGSGMKYRQFIDRMQRRYQRLQPIQTMSRPTLFTLIRNGAWRDIPFLFSSLYRVLSRTGLPEPIIRAMGIWTHVAGQQLIEAPSPLALVLPVIHQIGAWYPIGGIGTIPNSLWKVAQEHGVKFRFSAKVRSIRCEQGRVNGVVLDDDEELTADAVLSNSSGVGTYVELLDATPSHVHDRMKNLPLQSPGVCAYLAIKGTPTPPYLRFHLLRESSGCQLLITPTVMESELAHSDWKPARLLSPMDYRFAQDGGEEVQQAHLERMLSASWWSEHVQESKVMATRIPRQWGREHHLHRDSMNPVMTSKFMRAGRIAHRSPHVNGLYLAGSSTHPGQWVSFSAISGILAADRLCEDMKVC